jgi:hypothetical protein
LRQPRDPEDRNIVLLSKVAGFLYHLLDCAIGADQRSQTLKAVQLARLIARFQNAIRVEGERLALVQQEHELVISRIRSQTKR